jgi:hypothetical protein
MRKRLLFVPLLLVGVAFVACEDDDDPAGPATEFSAQLNGANERPDPVTTNATGTASFEIDGNTIDFTLTTTGLQNVTAAHIHGPADEEDAAGVIVGLFSAEAEGAWTGTKTASFDVSDITSDDVTTMEALIALMRSGDTYVNVHTQANPAGEIRGQIEPN